MKAVRLPPLLAIVLLVSQRSKLRSTRLGSEP